MSHPLRLSVLVNEIQEAIENRFEGETFWLTSEITDVKKYAGKRWCFLKFIEKQGNTISTEIKGVFWGGSYYQVEKFEQQTRQHFASGLEITCEVRVRFHQRFGLTLEVLQIDLSYTLGRMEMERQAVLMRLLQENPETIRFIDDQYITQNNRLDLPPVLQKIALIAAPGSDGHQDFMQEIQKNRCGYAFQVKEFPVLVQGDNASESMINQLKSIASASEDFDVVVIVRGGGSQTDFKPFDDYELSRKVASFSIPVFTGIGHDRNTSIVDLMARAHKTPTKVAAWIVDHNFNFEQEVLVLKDQFFQRLRKMMEEKSNEFTTLKESLEDILSSYLDNRKSELETMMRLVKNLSPSNLLAKGFAIVMLDDRIITDPGMIHQQALIKTILKSSVIHSTVTDKEPYEKQTDI